MFGTFVQALWSVMLELSPWLLLGAAVAGLLHVILPPGFVHKRLRGPRGVFEAVLLGVPLPLCSCGVIPAGLGLKKDGATNGASIAFITATPQTGVDSVLVSASFLGWPFALFKVAVAVVTGVVGGLLTDAVAGPGDDAAPPPVVDERRRNVRDGLEHSVEILENIWGWLVFGVVVSAAITTFVPTSTFAGFASLGALGAAAVVLLISIPLYVCATASVPIAAALVAGGMPVGAALVFLLAGPATNVATVGAVYRGFGAKALGVYLGNIVVGSMLGAWAFEALFELGGAVTMGGHEHTTWWSTAAAVVLTLALMKFSLDDLRIRLGRRAPTADAQVHEVRVDGMSCGGCVKKLTGRLQDADGVESVEVSLEPGLAVVHGPISVPAVHAVIEEAGFRVA